MTDNGYSPLRAEVQNFLKERISQERFHPFPDAWLLGYDRQFSEELGERGWIGMTWGPKYGGQGASYRDRFVVTEELLRAGAPVAAHWIADRQIGPSIAAYGSEGLKRELLPGIAAGKIHFCLGMSEPDAGSDLASVRTRAVRATNGWELTGQKIWSSNAHQANFGYILARTSEEESRHGGLTEFIIEMDDDGVDVRPIVDLRNQSHFNEIYLQSVFVPDRRVLGAVGSGWEQVVNQLSFERGGPERVLSTYPLLLVALHSLHLACERPTATRELALLMSQMGSLRQLAWQIAGHMDRGEAPVGLAATLKYLGTAFEVAVVERVRCAFAEVATTPGSRLYGAWSAGLAASPGFTIRGGTSEILLTILARDVIRARR